MHIITELDLAWERINALGGLENSEFNRAINDALDVIEELGGRDPIARRHENETRAD
jgi:hypothetical protein